MLVRRTMAPRFRRRRMKRPYEHFCRPPKLENRSETVRMITSDHGSTETVTTIANDKEGKVAKTSTETRTIDRGVTVMTVGTETTRGVQIAITISDRID